MYYVNDGVYGSFNCLVFDHATVEPLVLEEKNREMCSSSIWGPSCDSMDCITKSVMMPEVSIDTSTLNVVLHGSACNITVSFLLSVCSDCTWVTHIKP